MGGTAAKLARAGQSILFVDVCEGEPARHASRGVRHDQAAQSARTNTAPEFRSAVLA